MNRWKILWIFLKKLRTELPYDPAILLLGFYQKNIKAVIQKDIHTHIFMTTLLTRAKIWKQPKCPSADQIRSDQSLSRVRLRDPMNYSTLGLPVHRQLPEFTQTHVHRVSDAIQPSHPLSSPSPPAPNPSQHQSFFQ